MLILKLPFLFYKKYDIPVYIEKGGPYRNWNEMKILIKELPADLKNYPCHVIEQAYLNTNPVVRIRRQDATYILTYKGEGHMVPGGV